LKLAKQSDVNKVTAEYLWKNKRIHLCSLKGELFIACPNKAIEEWARQNYPNLGIWDYEKMEIVYHAQQSQTA
jgi:hypothetical protein